MSVKREKARRFRRRASLTITDHLRRKSNNTATYIFVIFVISVSMNLAAFYRFWNSDVRPFAKDVQASISEDWEDLYFLRDVQAGGVDLQDQILTTHELEFIRRHIREAVNALSPAEDFRSHDLCEVLRRHLSFCKGLP